MSELFSWIDSLADLMAVRAHTARENDADTLEYAEELDRFLRVIDRADFAIREFRMERPDVAMLLERKAKGYRAWIRVELEKITQGEA